MNKIKRAALCIIVISVVFGIKLSNKETDVSAKQTLFVMGDSKSSFYPRKRYPRQGWVQQFMPGQQQKFLSSLFRCLRAKEKLSHIIWKNVKIMKML